MNERTHPLLPMFALAVLLQVAIPVNAQQSSAVSQQTKPSEPALRVSVGDFRIVVRSPSWPWGLPTDPEAFYNDYRESIAKRGEPCYLRPPRDVPVHNSMPLLIRHPVTGDIIMRFTPYADAFAEHRMAGICISRDGGWSWTQPRLVKYVENIGPLKTGWIAISYEGGYVPDEPHKPRFLVSRSQDGIEWTHDEKEVSIEFPEHLTPRIIDHPVRGRYKKSSYVVIYKRIMERDGSLYASGYGEFNDTREGVCFLVRSDDDGHSWRFVSVIGEDYEPDYCVVAPGEWIAVHRSDLSREPRPLLQTRSRDGGLSWSKGAPAAGVELVAESGRQWRTSEGELYTQCSGAHVDPTLLRMGNGILALSYGRPGLHIRFSVDGKGEFWSHKTTILPKYGRTDGKAWVYPEASQYTHSYSGMVALSDRTLLLTSNIYGYCPTGEVGQGRDVSFVVPVSIRKPDDRDNGPPRIRGPEQVTIQPGREVHVTFDLSDSDGDWTRLVCAGADDIKIEGNTITWRMPWEFQGQKQITLVAEDAWGARSTGHQLTIQLAE